MKATRFLAAVGAGVIVIPPMLVAVAVVTAVEKYEDRRGRHWSSEWVNER